MSQPQDTDLLGQTLSADEQEILDLYRRLQALSARDDLAPSVLMNARQAMVMLWNACTDLGLIYEEPAQD